MDFTIVVAGIVESCILPNLVRSGENQIDLEILRLFRLLRILKVIHLLLSSVSWADSPAFETFMGLVIVLNSITVAMELDIPWSGWFWVESLILSVFIFELYVRIRHLGIMVFLVSGEDIAWHRLDTFIVVCALVDQWLIPLLHHMDSRSAFSERASKYLKIARMFRVARILRLVRLLRSIKPLYRLLLGVMMTAHSIKWVLFLGIVVIYAFAILFTLLVGHGVIFDGDVPEDAVRRFGTVPQSMLMLFKLMNTDQSVVDSLLDNTAGKVLFIVFMMVSNWALLALLTSVVSGDVIQVYQAEEAREAKELGDQANRKKSMRLLSCFKQFDPDKTGQIDADGFKILLADAVWGPTLISESGESEKNLLDLFQALACPTIDQRFVLKYDDLIDRLESRMGPATERSSLQVLNRLNVLEYQLEEMFKELLLSKQPREVPEPIQQEDNLEEECPKEASPQEKCPQEELPQEQRPERGQQEQAAETSPAQQNLRTKAQKVMTNTLRHLPVPHNQFSGFFHR